MLTLLGSRRVLCNGLSRRDLLHIGGLSLFGFGLSDALRLQPAPAAAGVAAGHFGRAKACILLYLFGAPPQHETFDPKPDAPVEIQGELKAVATSVPGVHIGEGLPQVAAIADRLTVVRSLTHSLPFHGVHYAVSGIPSISPVVEADPRDPQLWPFIGSVVDYLAQQAPDDLPPPVPRNIALPFVLYSKANFRPLGGPYGGFLGNRYDPVWTEFSAPGTRPVPNPTAQPGLLDPYGGVLPTDRFELAGSGELSDGMTPERLATRRSLLAQFAAARRAIEASDRVQSYDRYQQMAWSLVTSGRVGEALDIAREPDQTRQRYGMTLFGQASLAARRLVEAGSKFVTVFWDAYGDATAGWDTHFHHYPRLKEFLLPGFDQAFSGLILDLERRGLLDETLVIVLSEHGRTPQLTNRVGGGREHWSRVYSGVLAGGGIARGRVVGRSDAVGGDVLSTPVSPKDILATAFYLLGIDPHTTVADRLDRPVPIAGDGVLRSEFLA